MKKFIGTIATLGIIGLFILMPHENTHTYYRGIDGTNNGMHYETVTVRKQICTYIGNNQYVTSDGNIWEFECDKASKINHKYYITIDNNATESYFKDDIVKEVTK